MADITAKLTDKEAMDFIAKVEEPFKGVPHLPKGITEIFVKLAPWFALLGAVLGLIAGPLVGILGTLGSLLALSPLYLLVTVVTVVLTIANSILLFMAFTPLKSRAMKGWVFLFWSNMISIAESVVGVLGGGVGGLVGTVIGALIGLYILFEMKSFYSGKKAEK